ncbi:Enolase, C-terminal TIM barrel domain-containing protein [Mycena leptocephala]|nr:Enolase, C-terminal TIM barrel domain-containing protein [Mycena leptocephala]
MAVESKILRKRSENALLGGGCWLSVGKYPGTARQGHSNVSNPWIHGKDMIDSFHIGFRTLVGRIWQVANQTTTSLLRPCLPCVPTKRPKPAAMASHWQNKKRPRRNPQGWVNANRKEEVSFARFLSSTSSDEPHTTITTSLRPTLSAPLPGPSVLYPCLYSRYAYSVSRPRGARHDEVVDPLHRDHVYQPSSTIPSRVEMGQKHLRQKGQEAHQVQPRRRRLTTSSSNWTVPQGKLGAHAILDVSIASVPLYQHFADLAGIKPPFVLPCPAFNVINGGSHAGNKLAFQEFMLLPTGATSFTEAMKIGTETYHTLKKVISAKYGIDAVNVGDEGGFAPNVSGAEESLELLSEAIKNSGYEGKIQIALDVASSEFYKEGKYDLDFKTPNSDPSKWISGKELADLYMSYMKPRN